MKDLVKVNMNANVKIKLTEKGKEINNSLKNPFEEKVDGYISIALWEMAKFFGGEFYNGCDNLFELNSIIITDNHRGVEIL